jgi:hypothetical protein
MQINQKTIARRKLSKSRLLSDAAYSVRFACQLLNENKARYERKHLYWLGIYRSGTALHKKKIVDNAKRYDTIVRRTAAKLDDVHLVEIAKAEK